MSRALKCSTETNNLLTYAVYYVGNMFFFLGVKYIASEVTSSVATVCVPENNGFMNILIT